MKRQVNVLGFAGQRLSSARCCRKAAGDNTEMDKPGCFPVKPDFHLFLYVAKYHSSSDSPAPKPPPQIKKVKTILSSQTIQKQAYRQWFADPRSLGDWSMSRGPQCQKKTDQGRSLAYCNFKNRSSPIACHQTPDRNPSPQVSQQQYCRTPVTFGHSLMTSVEMLTFYRMSAHISKLKNFPQTYSACPSPVLGY